MIRNFIAAALAAASLAAPAQADRLQDVLDNGTLRVGVLLDAAPLGLHR
ncbi:hypothetical protein [Ponticoccus litoralis]|uniref:Uncharacterized protein n=1 Tax=Ponticoccus litoralis TaxID=422297 RepID=A0AAW9SGV5_9RHOB